MRSLSIICIFWSCQIKSAAGVFSCFCMQGQTLYSHLANNRTVISPLFLCLNWWRAEDEGWHWQCPFNILIGRSLPPVTHNTQRESYLINNKEKKWKPLPCVVWVEVVRLCWHLQRGINTCISIIGKRSHVCRIQIACAGGSYLKGNRSAFSQKTL